MSGDHAMERISAIKWYPIWRLRVDEWRASEEVDDMFLCDSWIAFKFNDHILLYLAPCLFRSLLDYRLFACIRAPQLKCNECAWKFIKCKRFVLLILQLKPLCSPPPPHFLPVGPDIKFTICPAFRGLTLEEYAHCQQRQRAPGYDNSNNDNNSTGGRRGGGIIIAFRVSIGAWLQFQSIHARVVIIPSAICN